MPIDARAPRPPRARRTPRGERHAVIALAAAGAALALTGGAAPTGIGLVDAAYVAGAGATMALAGGRSQRVAWLLSALAALWFAPDTLGRSVAAGALLLAVYAVWRGRRRVFGAVIGATLAFVAAHLGEGPFLGSTTLEATIIATPILVSGARLMPSRWRRPVVAALSVWIAAAALATLGFALSAALAVGDVTDGIEAAEAGFDLAAAGDQDGAARAFSSARTGFDGARGKVSGFWTLPARLVPVVGQHVRAVQVVAGEGVALADTAADAARAVDVDDVRVVDGGLDLGLLDDLRPVLDRTERALARADERVRAARSPWIVEPLDTRIVDLLDELAAARPSARTASAAARELPAMLGADGPVRWLVLLTTPAEARGLGGLVGNWAVVEADEGRLAIVRTGRNEDLNAALRAGGAELRGPAQYVERWGSSTPEQHFQDVTLAPDLPMVAEVAADLYHQATGTGVDGVVVADPFAIAGLLGLTGPVEAGDVVLDATSVVPYLLEGQYLAHENDELARVRTLGLLVDATFRAITSGELPGPRAVADRLGPLVDEDRLGVWWAHAAPGDVLLDAAGLDGRFVGIDADADADLVAVVHQNAGQNKLDTHLRRDLDYRLTVDDGAASATITVTLHNDLEDLTLPDAIIADNDQGNPLGTNVARVSVHSALDFRAARLDGEHLPVERSLAFGHEAITAVVAVPAGGSRTLEIDVAGTVDDDRYSLVLPHQPLVNDDRVTLSVVVDGVALDLPPGMTLSADTVLTAGAP